MERLRAWTSLPAPARRNEKLTWPVLALLLAGASENCRIGQNRYHWHPRVQNPRRCHRPSANGAGNRQGSTPSRAAIRAARSIAAEKRNRGRCRRASVSFGEPFNQPLSNAPATPVFARAGRRLDFLWGGQAVGCVDTQPLQARLGRFCRFQYGVRMRDSCESA